MKELKQLSMSILLPAIAFHGITVATLGSSFVHELEQTKHSIEEML